MKDDCIFCKLANGIFPTNSIYEDEDFNVILDLGPATRGHALILPKEHADNLFELPDETAAKVLVTVKKVATLMKQKLGCAGMNLVQNNGEVAGQTVNHFHIHIIPRYEADKSLVGWEPGEPSSEELAEIKKLITE